MYAIKTEKLTKKYVNGYKMLDDQRYMLERIVEIIKEKNPDALLIALKELRVDNDMSQTELAEKLNLKASVKSELDDLQRLVDRIPPDILAELKRQQRHTRER